MTIRENDDKNNNTIVYNLIKSCSENRNFGLNRDIIKVKHSHMLTVASSKIFDNNDAKRQRELDQQFHGGDEKIVSISAWI